LSKNRHFLFSSISERTKFLSEAKGFLSAKGGQGSASEASRFLFLKPYGS